MNVKEVAFKIKHGQDACFKVNKWNRLQASSWLSKAQNTIGATVEQAKDRASSFPEFLREPFARLISGDKLQRNEPVQPEFKYAEKLHSLLDEIPEWKRLCERCKGDQFNASVSATGLIQKLAEAVPSHEKDASSARNVEELLSEEWKESGEVQKTPGLVKAEQEKAEAEQEAIDKAKSIDSSKVRQAIRQAIASANEKIDEVDKAENALGRGWGTEQAGSGSEFAAEAKAQLAQRLSNHKLKTLLDLAGRMKNVMRTCQASKLNKGSSELTDIEQGSELSRLLPSEASLLTRHSTKLLLFRKLTENAALQYKLEAKENKEKGPVVVMIDDSGSMQGQREVWSKAIALALIELARKQKRAFAYCTFSSHITSEFAETKTKRTAPLSIIDTLLQFHGGGTSFDAAMNWGIEQIEKLGDLKQADLILITDGGARLTQEKEIKEKLKSKGVRTWGFLIGFSRIDDTSEGSLNSFCNTVHCVQSVVPGKENSAESEALNNLFSL